MKTILCACVIVLITLKGEAMRSVNFRDDVLHVVADKLGIDPEQSNFLTNEAVPIGKFIDQWVRRTYDARDWPEWTVTEQFAPVNHVVPWDTTGAIGGNVTKKIGRVLKVFLVDPATTDAPVDTPFTLREDGIHCGYEHGSYVWIRYIAPAPRFTAVSWRPDFTYRVDDTVYSYTTGECYKSKINGNLNHDPVSAPRPVLPFLPTEETRALQPAYVGTAPQPQIVDVYVAYSDGTPISDPMPNGDEFTLVTLDTLGNPLSGHTIVGDGATSIAAMLATLKIQCDGDALAGFTFTVFGADKKLRIQSTTTAFVIQNWQYSPAPNVVFNPLKRVSVQPLLAGTSPVDIVPQQLKLTMGDNEFLPGALYTLTFTDSDGTEHTVQYQSAAFDNKTQIFNGLALAIGACTDLTVANVAASVNTSEPSMTLSLIRQIGVNAQLRPIGSQYWDLVPFPKVLADQVIRGAYSDLLKEWGQTDKGAAEEQAVPAESEISAGNFSPMPSPPMTGQQSAMSRYKL
jgi:hypothetical protein